MSIQQSLSTAKKFKLTLKIKEKWEGRDGIGFNAILSLDGKGIAHVHNGGDGGMTDFDAMGTLDRLSNGEHKRSKELENNLNTISELEDKLAKEPEYFQKSPFHDGGGYMTKDNLEHIIDCLFDEVLFQKDLKKDVKKGILLERENGYEIVKFKAGTLANMLKKFPKDKVIEAFQKSVDKYKAQGETILNKEYLESVGVKV